MSFYGGFLLNAAVYAHQLIASFGPCEEETSPRLPRPHQTHRSQSRTTRSAVATQDHRSSPANNENCSCAKLQLCTASKQRWFGNIADSRLHASRPAVVHRLRSGESAQYPVLSNSVGGWANTYIAPHVGYRGKADIVRKRVRL